MGRVKQLLEESGSADGSVDPPKTTPRWKPRIVESWDPRERETHGSRADAVRLGYVWAAIVVVIATFAFLSHFGVLK
jgi:hypothetical protein